MAVEKRQSECQYIHFMSPQTDPWSHLYPACEGGDLHGAGVVARAAAVEVRDVPLLAQPLAEIIELHHDGGLHHLQPGLCRCTVPTCGHRGQQRGIDQAAVIPLAGRGGHAARETFQHSAPFLHPPNQLRNAVGTVYHLLTTMQCLCLCLCMRILGSVAVSTL